VATFDLGAVAKRLKSLIHFTKTARHLKNSTAKQQRKEKESN